MASASSLPKSRRRSAHVPGVIEAAVVAREDGVDGQRLIACIVGDGAQTPGVDTIRRYLRERIPGPMIPSRIRIVKALPRTPSGKVDRQSLAESLPHEEATSEGHVSSSRRARSTACGDLGRPAPDPPNRRDR